MIELGALDELLGFAPGSGEDFWPQWLRSSVVRDLESGRCDVETFASGLVDELNLSISPREVIERFVAFPRGLYPGAVEMVRSVPTGVKTGVLSNSNALHWEHQRDGEIVRSLFDHVYVSYQIGLLKPDRQCYEHVVADLGITPDRILFIDDNQINVDGAREAGLQAEVAKGPVEAGAVLSRYGLNPN